jgi:methionyl-tRNA formyltransferase
MLKTIFLGTPTLAVPFLDKLQEKGYLIDVELIAYGYQHGLKFLEIPPASKREVLDLVRTNNILSFIPKG